MIATYCVEGRWYYIDQATLVGGAITEGQRYKLWTGWIWVKEKKYHTDTTVTLIGVTAPGPATPLGFDRSKDQRVVLEMRRGLTVKTLKDGPPAFIINEQTLT